MREKMCWTWKLMSNNQSFSINIEKRGGFKTTPFFCLIWFQLQICIDGLLQVCFNIFLEIIQNCLPSHTL
jgi:hypothetical protein